MSLCKQCEDQAKKKTNGKPHDFLVEVGEKRTFGASRSRGFEEQDYQCAMCKSKFTHSSNRNDLAWTLWQG